jgi:hypothetical protein
MSSTELEGKGGVVTTTALPAPAIDPADVIALVPGTSPEDAARYASLATLAVQAAIWPNELPPAPMPAPLYAVTLMIAGRFARSGGGGAAVVSESIGGYTYRLATPTEGGLALLADELDALGPWAPSGAYDVSTYPSSAPLPYDYFQRDLDNELARQDELELEASP